MTKRFIFRHVERAGKHFLELTDDLGDINKAYAEMLLKRYEKNQKFRISTGRDQREMRSGIIGQRLFQSLLNQYKIPYIHDEPAFEFKEERITTDFIIPGFGQVEVKTRPWNTDTLIIARFLWDPSIREGTVPDYVIALMLSEDENSAEVKGWAHGKDVGGWPNAPRICMYSPCYSKLYDELEDFEEILPKLKACSLDTIEKALRRAKFKA